MRAYFLITAVIFGVVAVGHALRIAAHWPVVIAGWDAPLWISWIGAAVAGVLCAWAIRLLAQSAKH